MSEPTVEDMPPGWPWADIQASGLLEKVVNELARTNGEKTEVVCLMVMALHTEIERLEQYDEENQFK